jgi:hypothetical protein
MEELKNKLREFNYYKQFITNKKVGKRNVIVERKDGTHAIIPQHIDFHRPIPGLAMELDEIERITIVIGDKDYEFVACQ